MNLLPLNELYNDGLFAVAAGPIPPYDLAVEKNLDQPYLNATRSEQNNFPPLASISSTLPSFHVPHSPKTLQVCKQCKSQKYNFTAYFHNTKIFTKPPHHLLNWVERSYMLKNRLQSLLVTYTIQEVDSDCIQDIEVEIKKWGLQVDSLAHEVACCWSGSVQVLSPITDVHQGAKAVMKQIWGHVQGTQMMPVLKGRVKELVLTFRKGWERVWIACVAH